MSEEDFEFPSPHDKEVEHAAEHGGHHSFAGQIAVVTAVLATVGAMFSYMGGATQADAGLYKNDAAIKKTEASDQWNYYQAENTKQALAEQMRDLVADDRKAAYQAKSDHYEKRKAELKAGADKLEAESKAWDEKSEAEMHQHHRWAQATTVLQISIALAAIALLTRRRWLEYGMFGVAFIGLLLGGAAALHW